MQISRRSDYAVRILLYLATQGNQCKTAAIARHQLIPTSLTRGITRELVANGLLESHRGLVGGVRLARPPETISLLEIVESIDGPIRLNRCLTRSGECPLDRLCPAHRVWREGLDLLRGRLARATLAELAEQGKALRQSFWRKNEA
jgi:Rrf2 family protein